MITIAYNDFLFRLKTPFGWTLLAICQVILGSCYFLLLNNYYQKLKFAVPHKGVSYETIGLLIAIFVYLAIFIVPILSMHSIAYERRNQQLELLLRSPLATGSIVLGKFFGIVLFLMLNLLLIMLMTLPLAFSTWLDIGTLASALLGITLVIACYSAIAIYCSCLFKHPIIAGLTASLALFMTLMPSLLANTRISYIDNALNYLSLVNHFENLLFGLIQSSDLFYFIGITTLFLYLSNIQLQRERFG